MTAPVIAAEGLVKRYRAVTAVDGLSLAIPRGTIYGLIGPDGAGKTSVLRCLAGLLTIDGGSAHIAGYDVATGADLVQQLLGYMPQRFSLYQDLTVDENLRFLADLYQVPPAVRAQRRERLLSFTRLSGHTRKLAGQLSGGMKQKLALACVMIHGPELLLLDEPSTGVDPVSRKEFWDILLELKRTGVTVLVSTPYMDEAEKCDRIGLMARGQLLVEGRPADLRAAFPYRVLAVTAKPLYQAKALLAGLPGVQTAVIHGESVHLVTDAPEALRRAAAEALAGPDASLLGIVEVESSLEDVFVHLLLARGLGTLGVAP